MGTPHWNPTPVLEGQYKKEGDVGLRTGPESLPWSVTKAPSPRPGRVVLAGAQDDTP